MKSKSFTIFDYLLNGIYFLVYWPFKYMPSPVGDLLRFITTIPFLKSKSYVRLYEGTTIWYPYRVIIGKNVTINEWTYLSGFGGIQIGSGTSIGHRVSIISSSHGKLKSRLIKDQPIEKQEVKIGEDVWIGANVTILGGVQIGKGAILAAGSVINSDVPEYSIYGGVPGKEVSNRT
jgi:maltose O-acetyltransferase|tara:strand:- start:16309 stop:16836 length:528 start_codon:yes stop_codon:yes gene_type:complete